LRRGGHIGFRRLSEGGTWIAKWRNPDGKRQYRRFGTLADYPDKDPYAEACKRANEWFDTCSRPDAVSDRCTVTQAADHYKEHLLAEKGPRAEKDADMRIKAYIQPKFEKTYLDELTTAQLTRWRNTFVPAQGDEETLRKARDTANRHLNTFKALLNRAYRDGLVSSDTAWRNVARFEKAGVARKVLLTDKQIKRLLEHCNGAFHNLVKGLLLTGLRPGIEIEHTTCEQLRPDGYLEIRESKTGPREVHLSTEALTFLKTLAKDKTPKTRLFSRDDGKPWVNKDPERAMRDVRTKAKCPPELYCTACGIPISAEHWRTGPA